MSTNASKPARDWAALGIRWERIEKEARYGPNDSDRRAIGTLECPVIISAKTFLDAHSDKLATRCMTASSSNPVRSRAFWYPPSEKARAIRKHQMATLDIETQREMTYASIILGAKARGSSAATSTASVFGIVFNVGQEYVYADVWPKVVAAMIDANVPANVAPIVATSELARLGIVPNDEADDDMDDEA